GLPPLLQIVNLHGEIDLLRSQRLVLAPQREDTHDAGVAEEKRVRGEGRGEDRRGEDCLPPLGTLGGTSPQEPRLRRLGRALERGAHHDATASRERTRRKAAAPG